MIRLADQFGGAAYQSLSADLTLNENSPRVWRVTAPGAGRSIFLPRPSKVLYKGLRYYLINEGLVNSITLSLSTPVVHSYTTITAAAADASYQADGIDFIFPVGQQVVVSGFANGTNNGTKVVDNRATSGRINITSALANEAVSPLPGSGLTVTFTQTVLLTLPAQRIARVYCLDDRAGNPAWRIVCEDDPVGASHSFTRSGPTRTSVCLTDPVPPDPPPPPPPPPPYGGTVSGLQNCGSLGACASTKTVTIAGGAGAFAVYNGVWTVTKPVGGSYWRKIVDSRTYIDLLCVQDGGAHGKRWQVACEQSGMSNPIRFGNNTNAACPPNATYTCFVAAEEGSTCPGGMTCVVSA